MNISKILEYQEIDKNVYAIENNFRNSEEVKKVLNLQNKIQNISAALLKHDKEAEELFKQADKSEEMLNEAVSSFSELNLTTDNINEISELDVLQALVLKNDENIASLEREISVIQKKLNDIKNDCRRLTEQGNATNKELNGAKESYTVKATEMKVLAMPFMKQLSGIKANIEENTLAIYKNLRDKRKMPAFVPYNGGSCGGCGMEISIEVGALLKQEGDTAECPNCRRIVYFK